MKHIAFSAHYLYPSFSLERDGLPIGSGSPRLVQYKRKTGRFVATILRHGPHAMGLCWVQFTHPETRWVGYAWMRRDGYQATTGGREVSSLCADESALKECLALMREAGEPMPILDDEGEEDE